MIRARLRFATTVVAAIVAASGCGSPSRHERARRPIPPPRQDVRPAPAPRPPAPPSSSPAAPAVGRVGWAIQVGAFADVGNAERLAARLQEQGVDAFYFRRETGLFSVRFGDFPSRGAAEEEAGRLQARGTVSEWFVTPPAAAAPRPTPARPAGGSRDESDLGTVAARTAERFVGIPYRWGGNNVVEGMDCSGFVRAVYHLVGVAIPRTAAEQFKTGAAVDRRALRDGDLVFFGDGRKVTHVGIYAGRDRFVHAPSRGQDIKVSTLGEPWFTRNWVGGRRYF